MKGVPEYPGVFIERGLSPSGPVETHSGFSEFIIDWVFGPRQH